MLETLSRPVVVPQDQRVRFCAQLRRQPFGKRLVDLGLRVATGEVREDESVHVFEAVGVLCDLVDVDVPTRARLRGGCTEWGG